jgi:hypothetical protein
MTASNRREASIKRVRLDNHSVSNARRRAADNSIRKGKNSIPAEIRPLITERHILSSEDPKSYDDLLNLLIALYRPKSILQWLGVKNQQDLLWEQLRLNRIKPAIIETGRKDALVQLLTSIADTWVIDDTSTGNVTRAEEDATGWFTDPSERERVSDLLRQYNLSETAIDAKAFILHADALQILERMQMSNEERQYELRRQLEQERHLSINPPTTEIEKNGV